MISIFFSNCHYKNHQKSCNVHLRPCHLSPTMPISIYYLLTILPCTDVLPAWVALRFRVTVWMPRVSLIFI